MDRLTCKLAKYRVVFEDHRKGTWEWQAFGDLGTEGLNYSYVGVAEEAADCAVVKNYRLNDIDFERHSDSSRYNESDNSITQFGIISDDEYAAFLASFQQYYNKKKTQLDGSALLERVQSEAMQ